MLCRQAIFDAMLGALGGGRESPGGKSSGRWNGRLIDGTEWQGGSSWGFQ